MNDSDASLPRTVPKPTPRTDERPPAPGTAHDPYRTADYPAATAAHPAAPVALIPGFLVEKELARGGMGVVYQARDVAMNRTVAVKLLQDKYAPDSVVAGRFLEEAQITGQLQHPGIPPIYQMGQLTDGRPFLAMKLIKGETLDAKIIRGEKVNYLALSEAIALAVGYAHAHGIIHRDLKPQNIMVGAFGEVQVMDWGLAKLLRDEGGGMRDEERQDSAKSSFIPHPSSLILPAAGICTQAGTVLGTPAYMAPEQAAGEIAKINARSDVFGLGGVLCYMLTGQPPYLGADAETVRLQAVRGQTAEAFVRLDGCGAEPEVIALCKRCLAFVPTDRPTDGNAVAAEVAALRAAAEERARQAEIERARAEVFAAEQRKRRQVWLGLAATLLAGLLATSALAVWALHAEEQARTDRDEKEIQRQRAETQRQIADGERTKADEKAALANEVKDFLRRDVLQLADPAIQQQLRLGKTFDANVKLREVVLRAAKTIEGRFPTQPLVEAELRVTIGHALFGMGRVDLAAPHFARAHTLYAQHLGPDHHNTLLSMGNLAASYFHLGRFADALKLNDVVAARRKATLGPDHRDTLLSMMELANTYAALGRLTDALALREDTWTRQKATLGPDHPETLWSMGNLAGTYALLGRLEDARKLGEHTLARMKAVQGLDHPNTLQYLRDLAGLYSHLGREADALILRHEALTRLKTRLGLNHPETFRCMDDVGSSYRALGRLVEAVKLHEEALVGLKGALGPDHPDTLLAMGNLADSYHDQGQLAEALKLREEAVARWKATFGPDHFDTLTSMHDLAISYEALHRHREALALRKETLDRRKAALGLDHPKTLGSMANLAHSYHNLGRYAEACDLRVDTLARRKAVLGPDHPATLISMNDLAISYAALGRHADALALYRETSQKHEQMAASDLSNRTTLGGLQCNIGNELRALAQFAESVQAYGRAMEHLQTVLGQQPQSARARLYLRNVYWGRARAFENLQRYAEADADWAKSIEFSPQNQQSSLMNDRDAWKAKRSPPTSAKP